MSIPRRTRADRRGRHVVPVHDRVALAVTDLRLLHEQYVRLLGEHQPSEHDVVAVAQDWTTGRPGDFESVYGGIMAAVKIEGGGPR